MKKNSSLDQEEDNKTFLEKQLKRLVTDHLETLDAQTEKKIEFLGCLLTKCGDLKTFLEGLLNRLVADRATLVVPAAQKTQLPTTSPVDMLCAIAASASCCADVEAVLNSLPRQIDLELSEDVDGAFRAALYEALARMLAFDAQKNGSIVLRYVKTLSASYSMSGKLNFWVQWLQEASCTKKDSSSKSFVVAQAMELIYPASLRQQATVQEKITFLLQWLAKNSWVNREEKIKPFIVNYINDLVYDQLRIFDAQDSIKEKITFVIQVLTQNDWTQTHKTVQECLAKLLNSLIVGFLDQLPAISSNEAIELSDFSEPTPTLKTPLFASPAAKAKSKKPLLNAEYVTKLQQLAGPYLTEETKKRIEDSQHKAPGLCCVM